LSIPNYLTIYLPDQWFYRHGLSTHIGNQNRKTGNLRHVVAAGRRLRCFLSAATAAGHRRADAANPARWKGHLEHLLPKTRRKGKVRGPHPSLRYEDLPAFMRDLAGIDSVSARMLETTILTCARTNEIINMRWTDIDLDRALWRVPRELMKMDRDHVCPAPQAGNCLPA
jgi:integrase